MPIRAIRHKRLDTENVPRGNVNRGEFIHQKERKSFDPTKEVKTGHMNTNKNKSYSKPSAEQIKQMVTPLQYKVTQKKGTEPAYKNEYWDNKKEGVYVDIVSGEPLFGSLDKYDSGTGWPSFSKPLEPGNIVEKPDNKLFVKRAEVRSRIADSHLGHVFNDGPKPAGLRYCLNSAALRFIPRENLEREGYGEYARLFAK
jgi:methionine-R-sulfoxide reductase